MQIGPHHLPMPSLCFYALIMHQGPYYASRTHYAQALLMHLRPHYSPSFMMKAYGYNVGLGA